MTDIVKHGGKRKTEAYSREKLSKSILITLRSLKTPDGQAEDTAKTVCDSVEHWLTNLPEVTSDDLRRKAAAALEPLHPDAALLYKHHKIIM